MLVNGKLWRPKKSINCCYVLHIFNVFLTWFNLKKTKTFFLLNYSHRHLTKSRRSQRFRSRVVQKMSPCCNTKPAQRKEKGHIQISERVTIVHFTQRQVPNQSQGCASGPVYGTVCDRSVWMEFGWNWMEPCTVNEHITARELWALSWLWHSSSG